MKNYPVHEDTLDSYSKAHSGISGLVFSAVPPMIAWSKKAFETIGHSLFMANWVNESITLFWRTLSLHWAKNKNTRKSGSLLFDWLKFGVSTFMIFGAAILGGIATVAAFGVMLALNPAVCLAKATYFLGKMIASKKFEEREEHYSKFKKNIAGGIFSGVLGLCLASLILIPALPTAAAISLATIAATLTIPPVIIGLGAKIWQCGKWAVNKGKKWWRKKQGLQGPSYEYDLQAGTGLSDKKLQSKILYIDKLEEDGIGHRFLSYRFKDASGITHKGTFKEHALSAYGAWPNNMSDLHKLRPHLNTILLSASKGGILPIKPVLASSTTQKTIKSISALYDSQPKQDATNQSSDYYRHLSADKINSIEEVVEKIRQHATQLTHASTKSFFQKSKRQDKINALLILERVLTQWDGLFDKLKYQSSSSEYYSIRLDENHVINNIANPHLDNNVVRNKEIIIKRVQQYVLENYPDAFQSFFREKGEVEFLFNQGFDLIRRMKSEAEIENKKEAILKKINEYQSNYQGMRRFFSTDAETKERATSIEYLRQYLNNGDQRSIGEVPEMLSSVRGNGERFEIYQEICALKESDRFLHIHDATVNRKR